ncbi:MAG: TetR/AcrR family transcriptional regulator [Propionibacteriaceae bacterium]|nr:TetR/AcrR family transcriptional regulator [Propionibacteriaceae bacterium]
MESVTTDGKPLTRTQQARQGDIIAAAIHVLDAEGFAAASVERIAQAASTSKSTVLYHFTTKEAIYREVVRSLYEQGNASMTAQIDPQASPGEQLRAYLEANLRFLAAHAAHVNALHRILENQPSVYSLPDGVAEVSTILREGQACGDFGEFDPEVMAQAIRAVVDGFSFRMGDALSPERRITEIVGLFTRATAAHKEFS